MSIKAYLTIWKREAREKALGRIEFDAARWCFSEVAPPLGKDESEQSRLARKDVNGRESVLIRGRGTWCKNLQWRDLFPYFAGPGYSISYGACHKCEHYIKGGKKIRFPRCAWSATATTKQQAKSVAARDMLGLIDRAVGDADEILS